MSLFPNIEPFDSHFLQVSGLHTVYVEEAGNPDGKPVIFVHGGPGGGIEPIYRQYFNPKKWRIILFDQRGCGQSTPFAELKDNTTWDLVSDMEKIRNHLQIEEWVVFGGSWGSTLSLAYAQSHPERVKGLILRGIFLLRKKEIRWFYQEGTSNIYPDAWEKFVEPIDEGERNNLLSAYYKRLTSNNRAIRLEAAKAWSIWEGSTSKLLPSNRASRAWEIETKDNKIRLIFNNFVYKDDRHSRPLNNPQSRTEKKHFLRHLNHSKDNCKQFSKQLIDYLKEKKVDEW